MQGVFDWNECDGRPRMTMTELSGIHTMTVMQEEMKNKGKWEKKKKNHRVRFELPPEPPTAGRLCPDPEAISAPAD